MNNVLIVGGAGYIGGQIAKNNPEWDVYDNLLFEKYFYLPNKFIFGDIRDTEKLSKILPKYDTVIWLAAIVGDGACTLNPLLTKEVNEYATKWLVDNYDGRIIFMSTCSVYGVSKHSKVTETHPLKPITEYNKYKASCEKKFLNIIPSNIYGPYANFDSMNSMVVASLIRKVLDGENPLKVWGDGSAIRDFVYSEDVAEGMIQVVLKKIHFYVYQNLKLLMRK